MPNVRLGADPEVFLQQGNKLFSAIDRVGGSKKFPRPIEGLPEGYTVQEDNVALEFGIPPAESREAFITSIERVMLATKEKITKDFTFSNLSCVVMPEDQMQDSRAYVFGCEPDYNAWTGRKNRMPKVDNKYLRSAGGHVHVETVLDKQLVIKYMDLFLGVPSILMDNGKERKKLYGKAGAYRPKSYGVEYRTLSNFWIFNPDLCSWVWEQTQNAVAAAEDDDFTIDNYRADIEAAINNDDLSIANALISTFQLEVCNVC